MVDGSSTDGFTGLRREAAQTSHIQFENQLRTEHLISVIMPARDAARHIGPAIESVLAQDYRCWELLVIDDHSVDETAEIIRSFSVRDPRVVPLTMGAQNAKGAGAARNYGIRHSRGRYIAFLDSDDLWLPRKLSIQLAALESGNAALCYSGYKKMSEDGSLGKGVVRVPSTTSYSELLKSNVIGCSTVIFDTAVLGKTFMPEAPVESGHYFEDYAMWLGIARGLIESEQSLIGVDEPLVIYRVRKGSVSYDKWRAAQYTWRVYRRMENISFYSAAYHFCHYAVRGWQKYLIR